MFFRRVVIEVIKIEVDGNGTHHLDQASSHGSSSKNFGMGLHFVFFLLVVNDKIKLFNFSYRD